MARPTVDTQLKRIEYVLRANQWSARGWAKLAGLAERSHLTTIMRRLRIDPEADVSLRIMAKLAEAANVSLDWLALGRGTPAGTFVTVDVDPRYPQRGVAMAAARIVGWAPEALARVLEVDNFPSDPGLDYWLALLQAEHKAANNGFPPNGNGNGNGNGKAPIRTAPKKRVATRQRR